MREKTAREYNEEIPVLSLGIMLNKMRTWKRYSNDQGARQLTIEETGKLSLGGGGLFEEIFASQHRFLTLNLCETDLQNLTLYTRQAFFCI